MDLMYVCKSMQWAIVRQFRCIHIYFYFQMSSLGHMACVLHYKEMSSCVTMCTYLIIKSSTENNSFSLIGKKGPEDDLRQ